MVRPRGTPKSHLLIGESGAKKLLISTWDFGASSKKNTISALEKYRKSIILHCERAILNQKPIKTYGFLIQIPQNVGFRYGNCSERGSRNTPSPRDSPGFASFRVASLLPFTSHGRPLIGPNIAKYCQTGLCTSNSTTVVEEVCWQGRCAVAVLVALDEEEHAVLVEDCRVAGKLVIERHQLQARPIPVGGQHDDDDDDDDGDGDDDDGPRNTKKNYIYKLPIDRPWRLLLVLIRFRR